MASSCFLHSPFLPPRPSSSSSSSNLILSPQPFFTSLKNAGLKRKISAPLMASINTPDSFPPNRRVLIFLGVSILPFLKWKNRAPPVSAAGGDVQKTQSGTDEQGLERARPPNPFVSLINAIGTLGSGIFGALYALARRDKIALEDKIESLTNELKEKDATMVSMEKNYESKLSQQHEEGKKQLSRAREEQFSLTNQLNTANSTISAIERTLLCEKAKTEELEGRINGLQARFLKINEDKLSLEVKLREKNDSFSLLQENMKLLSSEVKDKEEAIQNLNSLLGLKDVDLRKRDAEYDCVKNELARMKLEKSGLVEDLVRVKTELTQKGEMVNVLNSRLRTLEAERDELKTDYNTLSKEYEGSYSKLENELARVQAELSGQLLTKTRELEAVSEHRNSLEKELIEVYQKAETATRAAQEGKTVISSLNAELRSLEKQTTKEKESRRILETDLDEATKALDEMNKQTMSFSRELEMASTRIRDLREEKERLSKELDEHKKASVEASENLGGAQRVIMRLGSERGSLEGKVRELEMELASSKSEMLKLKTKGKPLRDEVKVGVEEAHEPIKAAPMKKNARRRKGSS